MSEAPTSLQMSRTLSVTFTYISWILLDISRSLWT